MIELYNRELEQQVHKLFQELAAKTDKIILNSRTKAEATERIMRLVSSTISAEAEGYMIDMYACLVNKIKKEDYFKDPKHLNAFYRLNLREQLNQKYQFNIEDIDTYKKGIEYKEIHQLYIAAGTAAGTLAVGSILKFALLGVLKIPFVVIIAGAVAVACTTYSVIPIRKKKEYKKAIDKFMRNLENDILNWFVDIEVYFDEQIRMLYQ